MEIFSEKENNTSHDNADILCDPCEGNNETKTAENYCVDCNEFLCDGCAKVHRKSKMLLHHKILYGPKMPKKKLVLSSDDVCSRHDGKPLEYFCNDHGGFYCAPCVTLEHRSCSLKYLTEEAKGFSESEDYRDIKGKIQMVNQRISQTKDKIRACTEEAKSNHLKFLQEIQEFRNKIETIVQAVEDAAKEKADVIQQKDLYAFNKFSIRSEEMANETDRLSEELDNLRACEQQSRLFIAAKRIATKLDTLDTEVNEIDSKARVSLYNFRGKEIMKLNIESWGKVEVLESADKPILPHELNIKEYEIGSAITIEDESVVLQDNLYTLKSQSPLTTYENPSTSDLCRIDTLESADMTKNQYIDLDFETYGNFYNCPDTGAAISELSEDFSDQIRPDYETSEKEVGKKFYNYRDKRAAISELSEDFSDQIRPDYETSEKEVGKKGVHNKTSASINDRDQLRRKRSGYLKSFFDFVDDQENI